MPTERQILGAKIRAEREKYELKHRRRKDGEWCFPERSKIYAHLAKTFGISKTEVSYFMTYSRYCTHSWASGACDKCPD
jgi:hypothetical protein